MKVKFFGLVGVDGDDDVVTFGNFPFLGFDLLSFAKGYGDVLDWFTRW